jgi:hypothetical protein
MARLFIGEVIACEAAGKPSVAVQLRLGRSVERRTQIGRQSRQAQFGRNREAQENCIRTPSWRSTSPTRQSKNTRHCGGYCFTNHSSRVRTRAVRTASIGHPWPWRHLNCCAAASPGHPWPPRVPPGHPWPPGHLGILPFALGLLPGVSASGGRR